MKSPKSVFLEDVIQVDRPSTSSMKGRACICAYVLIGVMCLMACAAI